ncbi:MAG: CDP-diacylglycerol--glycerol-3-phosphate 3-phosphatidyltransferase [Ruminococcaceae bacterium]|nr:CDP-diacylglycerol--glycerol-3-phosphate 3-phosphatidyltransferase [Oscillospiraceae bacterium]
MNTANKFTLARIILVPLFLLFIYLDAIPYNYFWAALIFIVASITDLIDGHIARKNKIVTNFGKFLDPIADKILVISALICFIDLNFAHSVSVIIVITREFIVSGIRLLSLSVGGVAVSANWWGKVKTVLQMIGIIAVLIAYEFGKTVLSNGTFTELVAKVSNIYMWALAVYTLVSGMTYVIQNKEIIFKDM